MDVHRGGSWEEDAVRRWPPAAKDRLRGKQTRDTLALGFQPPQLGETKFLLSPQFIAFYHGSPSRLHCSVKSFQYLKARVFSTIASLCFLHDGRSSTKRGEETDLEKEPNTPSRGCVLRYDTHRHFITSFREVSSPGHRTPQNRGL